MWYTNYMITKLWPTLVVSLSLIFLVLAAFLGLSRGTAQAQAQATFEQAKQIKQAMDYFYGDNNRYPTDAEFTDQSIMGGYFRNWPMEQFNTAACPQSFVYKELSPTSYQLNFCLESPVGGYSAGWNGVVESQ